MRIMLVTDKSKRREKKEEREVVKERRYRYRKEDGGLRRV
jgi:hypothetical protein